MPKGQFTAADLDAPSLGQTGQFSAADLDQGGASQTPPGLGQQVVEWLHNTFAPRLAADAPGAKPPTGEMPGSFEGHPENIGEYVPRTAGEMAGGVKDILRGDIAKGAHRVISGAGEAAAPVVLPFAAAAAPAATAVALGSGAVGQTVGKEGAKALGATEDQSDLAGDITGIGAGYGASKLPVGRVASVAGKLAKGTLEDIPGVRQAGKISQYWKESQPTGTPLVSDVPLGPEPQPEGTPLLYKQPAGPETPDPNLLRSRNLANANIPAAQPASQTGEALGQIKRGDISKAINSPVRTLPGQIPPEVVQPPAPTPAAPIPSREGLALPSAPKGAELNELPAPKVAPTNQADALGQPVQRGAIAKASTSDAPIKRGSLAQMLQDQLNQSLGAKELNPKMPLRQQMDATPTTSNSGLPEGHTQIEGSSALRSYKYDPSAREFHARATSGDTTYVYGDVSPEEVQAFEQADSKGKAWQGIRQNPLVAKIVNGKRLPTISAAR